MTIWSFFTVENALFIPAVLIVMVAGLINSDEVNRKVRFCRRIGLASAVTMASLAAWAQYLRLRLEIATQQLTLPERMMGGWAYVAICVTVAITAIFMLIGSERNRHWHKLNDGVSL